MRSSPRSGRCGWTQSCASRGSTPGNSARPMMTAHGWVTGMSPSQATGAMAWVAARAASGFTAPAGRKIRTSSGYATRPPASRRGAVAARPTVTRSGGETPSGADPPPLCQSRNTTGSQSRPPPPGATRHIGGATPGMTRGRWIRAIPTNAALRGAAWTTTAAPMPLETATTERTTTATPGTGARRGAEAAPRTSGQRLAPGAATWPQGARGSRAATDLRQPRPAAPSPQPRALSTRSPRAPRRRETAVAHHEDMDQEGAGSWGWGWWNASTWQSGSSGSEWWNQAGQGDNADDAWSQWNRNRRAPRSNAGYGGADRPRPKPAHTAAALERNLSREGWIEELIADSPNPAH